MIKVDQQNNWIYNLYKRVLLKIQPRAPKCISRDLRTCKIQNKQEKRVYII